MSEIPETKTSSSALLLKKRLAIEIKKRKLLAQKQAKTLAAFRTRSQALKQVKVKLLKYQKAYALLKKKAAAGSVDNSRIEGLENELARLEADLKRSQERMSKTLGLLKDSKTEQKELKARFREAQGLARQAQSQLQKGAERETELLALRARCEELEKAFKESQQSPPPDPSLALLQLELEATREEVLALQDEALETAEEIAERDNEIADLQSQLSDLNAHFASTAEQATDGALTATLQKELEQALSSIDNLESELAASQHAQAVAEVARGQQTEKLTQLAEAFAQLQDAHRHSRVSDNEELEEARSQVAELQATLLEESERNTELELAREQAEKRLAAREKEHEDVQLKLWDLEERIQNQGGELEGALGAKVAEISDLKRERSAKEELLSQAHSEREKALARLKESRDETARLEAEQQQNRQEVDEAKGRITELETRLLTLSQKSDDESSKLATALVEVDELTEQIQTLKSQNSQLQLSLENSGETQDREPAEQRATRAEARLKELEEQLVDTRSRLLSSHNEMDEIDQARLAALANSQALEKDLEFRTSQIQQLENLVALLEQKEETHNRQLQAMRRQITELLEESGQAKEELRDKTSRLLRVEKSFEEADETLSNLRRRYENTSEAFEKAKDELTEARTRALQSMARTDEAEKKFGLCDKAGRKLAEENKLLKRKLDRLQERVAELEMLS